MQKQLKAMNTTAVKIDREAEIHLLLGPNKEWLGIGDVTVGGIPLRDGSLPLLPRLDTPEGYQYDRAFLEGIRRGKGGETRIILRLIGTPGLRQEYMDEYEQALVNVSLPREPIEDRLILELKPVSLRLGDRDWIGFSYSLRFTSAKRKMHRLVVDGSWELGGSIVGNTVLNQGQCNMPVYRGAKSTVFTSACLKTLEQYGKSHGYSYQLGPRGGLIQAFDFQYGKRGALFQYWPRFKSVSSIIESPKGSTRLRVLDEYRVELSGHAATTPQHVLFTPGPIADHEARDLWWAARELAYGGIRQPFQVQPTPVVPEMRPSYTTRIVDGGVKMTVVPGVEADSREVPYAIGDHLFPRLAKAGIRRFFPEPMSESDVTVDGLKRKCDAGIHGDLCCGSICATHRMLPSEFWGGMKAWRYMAKLEDMLFRMMANRGGAIIHRYNLEHELPEWHVKLNRLYMQALPHMTGAQRTILPRGAGVRWDCADTAVVWAYKDFQLHPERGQTVEQLDGAMTFPSRQTFTPHVLKAGTVYRIHSRLL